MAAKPKPKKAKSKKDIAASYNQFKIHEGKQYTGMKIGRSHKWYYDKGVWNDKKITPDRWEISFATKKRRAGKAPEGSGAAVGTEYHWYIIAHQMVKKLDANTYATDLRGVKFKLSHKRASKDDWNINTDKQRKQMIHFLQTMMDELMEEPQPVPDIYEPGPTKKSTKSKKGVQSKRKK